MTTRADVIAEARRWMGTPFQHQGRTRGLGCDCRGLVGGVAVALGLVPPTWWADFDQRFGGYPTQPPPGMMARACDAFMVPTDDPQPGDVVIIAFASDPQHMGILADYAHGGLSLIHAIAYGSAGVREHRLSPTWRALVTRAYILPGVA
jgi:NlpC/P60 family putative phage cell wall peptidase